MTTARLSVDSVAASEKEGIALLSLASAGGGTLAQLDLEFSRLAPLRNTNPAALDFLLLASTVYGLDKMVAREATGDSWTRDFDVTSPVSDPGRWNDNRAPLLASLDFLSGDRWDVDFVAHSSNVLRPRSRRRRRRSVLPAPPRADLACLFSGGLDSLVGVIDILESEESTVILVGHHDGQMAGPLSDQNRLLSGLRTQYPNRIHQVLVRVGHSSKAEDITLRCRSLLFIALGIYGASAFGPNVPLVVPENGTIALNVPLTPSRRGSCSTRTTHPTFLRGLGQFLSAVGLTNPIITPLAAKTKGEAVAQCLNPELLEKLTPFSVSCAKRGHKSTWVRKSAKSCGRCMPCIYRRAALHKVGWDSERYGTDICRGEVDVDGPGQAANDLRACLSFLRSDPTNSEIQTLLLCNGSLPISSLPAYADTVQRAMNEIRTLLSDKGTAKIRRLAGL